MFRNCFFFVLVEEVEGCFLDRFILRLYGFRILGYIKIRKGVLLKLENWMRV